jgi:hypothetical protein
LYTYTNSISPEAAADPSSDQMFNNPANVEYDEEDEILARVLQESLNAGDEGFY